MRFITFWFVVLWVAFSVILIGMFTVLSRQLEYYLIRKNNRSNMRDYKQHLLIDPDGNVTVEGVDPLEEGYYVVIQDPDGNRVYGECPEALDGYVFNIQEDSYESLMGDRFIASNLKIRRKEDYNGKSYRVCGIADTVIVTTIFDDLKLVVIGFTVFSVLVLAGIYLFMKRRIDLPLNKMAEAAAEMSATTVNPKKLQYESGFYEIDTLEKAYLNLYEKMAAVIERQEHFNSNVSHELRTPVTVIQAQCQAVRETSAKELDGNIGEAFDVIERQAEKMREIINILLRLSRLKSGTAKLELEEIDLGYVIEAVCDEAIVEEAHREVAYELQDAVICADLNLIAIAVRNLVSNALKYSDENSKILARCGIKDGRAYCSICDHGIGIREEAVDRIYDSFYRGEESRSSDGFGLGLALTRQIMEIHGGEIQVISNPGEGSTFTLWFPVEKHRQLS